MAGSTNFQQFNPEAANQETDEQYTADASRAGGFAVDAIVTSPLLNKALYQTTTMDAAIAQALANKGFTVSDSDFNSLVGELANILTTADLRQLENNMSFSAIATFDVSKYSSFLINLSGNLTEMIMLGLTPGQTFTLSFQQNNVGGWGVTFPIGSGGFFNPGPAQPDPTPGAITTQQFIVMSDGIARPLGPAMVSAD